MDLDGAAVLVTGATSYIGDAVCERLVQSGARVRGTSRGEATVPGVEMFRADLTAPESFAPALEGADGVVHAAVSPATYFDGDDLDEALAIDLAGTTALARMAQRAGVERFVHLSTCAVYDMRDVDVVTEESPRWPLDADVQWFIYGLVKAAIDRRMEDLRTERLPTTVLRFCDVVGIGRTTSLEARLADLLLSGKLQLEGDGTQTKPIVHLRNLADVIATCLEHPAAPGETFLVVDSHTTRAEFVSHFEEWLGVEVGHTEPSMPWANWRGTFATDKVRRVLGYEPTVTYEQALAEARQHLEETGRITR